MKKYTINKGGHSSGFHLGLVCKDILEFDVMFTDSAKYKTILRENQFDINKLYGFSDYNSFHHNNSARFGWRWVNDELQIFAYCYVDGERKVQYIGNVELNESYIFKLSLTKDAYLFSIDGNEEISISRKAKMNYGVKYKLYPYFGGDETSPHKMEVYIKDM
jgi:hypothetical protein